MIRQIPCQHDSAGMEAELNVMVDHGCTVLDVIVEHSVYGKISAELNITSRYEADLFVEKLQETGACPLSALTEGIHIHTVSVKDEETFARITKKLKDLGILIEAE